ncbi:MAG: hypothetical protein AB1442_05160, partial [Nitrospirota bacterium]
KGNPFQEVDTGNAFPLEAPHKIVPLEPDLSNRCPIDDEIIPRDIHNFETLCFAHRFLQCVQRFTCEVIDGGVFQRIKRAI